MDALELTTYLDDFLRVVDVRDYKRAYNGLQVEGAPNVQRVAMAVDACQWTIDGAIGAGATLLIVHHGLFWANPAPITGTQYRRLKAIIMGGLGVYSCHLPLDLHPEVGNNHVLARKLGLRPDGEFAEFEGRPVGVTATAQISRSELISRVAEVLNVNPFVIAAGPDEVQRIGILTGGGGSLIREAHAAGLDTYLTGEGAHHTYFDAEELRLNVIYAGHYATETVGLRALGDHLRSRFGLDVTFLDHPTGL